MTEVGRNLKDATQNPEYRREILRKNAEKFKREVESGRKKKDPREGKVD